MTIKVKCPVCNAKNSLTPNKKTCRRCEEDLTLLYQTKGYAYKYRIQLSQVLNHPNEMLRKQFSYFTQNLIDPS